MAKECGDKLLLIFNVAKCNVTRHHADIVASSAVWCGEEMVMLFSDTGSTWLHVSGETEMMFQPASLCVVQVMI